MIKARADNLIIFGLSKENIKRLQEEKPISFNGKDLGFPELKFFIFVGDTEDSMVRDLEDLIRPELLNLSDSKPI